MATSTGTVTYGIELNWGPNTLDTLGNTINPGAVIHATTSAAPSTSDWGLVVKLRKGQTSYIHALTNDGKRRYYRIRHELLGYQASTWLGTVDAKPTEIFDI